MKTEHCKEFLLECANGFQHWIENEDKLRAIAQAASKDDEDAARAVIAILDDKDDIMPSLASGQCKIG